MAITIYFIMKGLSLCQRQKQFLGVVGIETDVILQETAVGLLNSPYLQMCVPRNPGIFLYIMHILLGCNDRESQLHVHQKTSLKKGRIINILEA